MWPPRAMTDERADGRAISGTSSLLVSQHTNFMSQMVQVFVQLRRSRRDRLGSKEWVNMTESNHKCLSSLCMHSVNTLLESLWTVEMGCHSLTESIHRPASSQASLAYP